MTASPFLNSNPKDLAYALGQTSAALKLAYGEWYEVILSNGKVPFYTTGRLRFETLKHLHVRRRNAHSRRNARGHLVVTKFVKGVPYQVIFRLASTDLPVRGNMVTVSGSMIQSSRSMRSARAWSVRQGRTSYSAVPRVPQSTNLRPSPEFLQRPFLRTNQFGTPGSVTTNQSIVPLTVYFREWSGTRTPGWGKLKRKQYGVHNNNHYVRIVEQTENRYSWYQVHTVLGSFETRIYPFTEVYAAPTPPFPHLDLAEFNALNRLIANAQQGIQANLAQNIAQVSQLSSLIFGNATKIASSLSQLKRGNIPGAISALGAGTNPRWRGPVGRPSAAKSVAQNWLQLQYGWKPLLYDIKGFFNTMATLNEPHDIVQKVRSSAQVTRTFESDYPNAGPATGSTSGKTVFTMQTKCKLVIQYKMDNPLTNLFAQTGFTNPINLFWEILPFSFVVDWFMPIGSYLQAFSAWDGLTFLGGSKTQFTRIKTDSSIGYGGAYVGTPNVVLNHYANFCNEQIRLNRTALTSFPSPIVPRFTGSGIQGGVRAQNAIALLVSALK